MIILNREDVDAPRGTAERPTEDLELVPFDVDALSRAAESRWGSTVSAM